ncbi:hypothetical protein NE237_008075 [Protea cynaroides]|uniref:Uncharacterized protein n=1 Tax=Protea cynaroides TaxID=273540 RepID=A0A9Q0KRF0_9MAGN|nr:hypothetical protein NE237_008075 [Protea cynaroides]
MRSKKKRLGYYWSQNERWRWGNNDPLEEAREPVSGGELRELAALAEEGEVEMSFHLCLLSINGKAMWKRTTSTSLTTVGGQKRPQGTILPIVLPPSLNPNYIVQPCSSQLHSSSHK